MATRLPKRSVNFAAVMAVAPPEGPRGWRDRMPREEMENLLAIRSEWRAAFAEGRAPHPLTFAKALRKVASHLSLPAPRTLAEWLKHDG